MSRTKLYLGAFIIFIITVIVTIYSESRIRNCITGSDDFGGTHSVDSVNISILQEVHDKIEYANNYRFGYAKQMIDSAIGNRRYYIRFQRSNFPRLSSNINAVVTVDNQCTPIWVEFYMPDIFKDFPKYVPNE